MTLTATDLLEMSHDELDELFRASPAGPIPMGEGEGTVIFAPDTPVSDVAAKLVHLIAWKGKVFDPARGELRTPLVRTLFGPRSTTRRAGSIRNKRSSLTTARPRYWHIGYAMRFALSFRASISGSSSGTATRSSISPCISAYRLCNGHAPTVVVSTVRARASSLRENPRPGRAGTCIRPSAIRSRSLNRGSSHSKCSTQASNAYAADRCR